MPWLLATAFFGGGLGPALLMVGLVALREPWNISLALAGALMAFGVWLHLAEESNQTAIAEPST